MATNKKSAVDFDEIIKADRQRRKNEALAKQIFGKGRRASAPGAGIGPRKPGTGPSLASRIGVAKRSVSSSVRVAGVVRGGKQGIKQATRPTLPAGNVDADWTHDLHDASSTSTSRATTKPLRSRNDRGSRFNNAINGSASSPALTEQFNIVGGLKQSAGMSIRGIAGPCAVQAQNFAPGTTAADIESAMAPVGGRIMRCRIITAVPTVIAEIIFETREGADNVIDTFNNQTADGRLLHLFIKTGVANLPSALLAAKPDNTPTGPRASLARERSDVGRSDERYATTDRYEPRPRSKEPARSYEREEVVDGSYGFDERMETDEPEVDYPSSGTGRGLYSDNIVNGRVNQAGNRGAEREIYRGRGRGGNRDRGRGGDRARGYR